MKDFRFALIVCILAVVNVWPTNVSSDPFITETRRRRGKEQLKHDCLLLFTSDTGCTPHELADHVIAKHREMGFSKPGRPAADLVAGLKRIKDEEVDQDLIDDVVRVIKQRNDEDFAHQGRTTGKKRKAKSAASDGKLSSSK